MTSIVSFRARSGTGAGAGASGRLGKSKPFQWAMESARTFGRFVTLVICIHILIDHQPTSMNANVCEISLRMTPIHAAIAQEIRRRLLICPEAIRETKY